MNLPCARCGWSTYVPPEVEPLPGNPLCGNCAAITAFWETKEEQDAQHPRPQPHHAP